jgi:hypothetical protein
LEDFSSKEEKFEQWRYNSLSAAVKECGSFLLPEIWCSWKEISCFCRIMLWEDRIVQNKVS